MAKAFLLSLLLVGCAAPRSEPPPPPPPVAPSPPSRFLSYKEAVTVVVAQARFKGIKQIPATLIDNGVFAAVPYMSFRAGEYEMNVYGDPDAPAGIELGVSNGQDDDKHALIDLFDALLRDKQDAAALGGLGIAPKKNEIRGLSVEVTPETAPDAYGAWWISGYDQVLLDKAKAGDTELSEITTTEQAPAVEGESWSESDYKDSKRYQAKKGWRVFVRGFYRRNGTYGRSHR